MKPNLFLLFLSLLSLHACNNGHNEAQEQVQTQIEKNKQDEANRQAARALEIQNTINGRTEYDYSGTIGDEPVNLHLTYTPTGDRISQANGWFYFIKDGEAGKYTLRGEHRMGDISLNETRNDKSTGSISLTATDNGYSGSRTAPNMKSMSVKIVQRKQAE